MTGERLTLVHSGEPKRKKHRHRLWDGCQACEIAIGVRSRTLISTIQSPGIDTKGKLVGGRKVLVCALCLTRGKITPHSI